MDVSAPERPQRFLKASHMYPKASKIEQKSIKKTCIEPAPSIQMFFRLTRKTHRHEQYNDNNNRQRQTNKTTNHVENSHILSRRETHYVICSRTKLNNNKTKANRISGSSILALVIVLPGFW